MRILLEEQLIRSRFSQIRLETTELDAFLMTVALSLSLSLSLRSMSRRRSRFHELTPCRSVQSARPCRRQGKIEWA